MLENASSSSDSPPVSSCGEILFAVGILLQELILERVDLSRSFVREDVGYLNVS